MDDLAFRIRSFFKRRLKTHAQITHPSLLGGWNEEFRAKFSQKMRTLEIAKKDELPYSKLICSIYTVYASDLSTVFAIYNDKLLWLDDHTDNGDFSDFTQREQLLSWIPDRFPDFLSVITETKFNFLGLPNVIYSVSNVPEIPERYKAHLTQIEFSEWEKRLSDIANQVHLPHIISREDNAVTFSFCIWTKIGGKVFDLVCSFGSSGRFDYNGKMLAEGIGNFVAPH